MNKGLVRQYFILFHIMSVYDMLQYLGDRAMTQDILYHVTAYLVIFVCSM